MKLISAYQGIKQETPPVWFMRQAGRYLPEYRELRKKHRMLEMIQTPELAAEVTLQPLRRFDFDAAIIFADILNPLIGMGIELDFVDGEGPKIFNPIKTAIDVERLIIPENTEHVVGTLNALKIVSSELGKRNLPVLGFCGAPFTLSSYIIDGTSTGALAKTKRFMFQNPGAWHDLQQKILAMLKDYLCAQVQAGAAALQIFDSWLGYLNLEEYQTFVEPYLIELCQQVSQKTQVPLIFFGTGISHLRASLKKLPVQVMGIDWRENLDCAAKALDNKFCLQGNLDPMYLYASQDVLAKELDRILVESKSVKSYCFNLGHGITPETPIENVEFVIKHIKG